MNRRFWQYAEFWIISLIAIFLAIGVVGGYYGWQQRQIANYSVSCRELMKARKWTDLQQLAGQWAVRQPKSADPWIYLAEAAQNSGDINMAAEYLRQLPPEDPKSIPAMMELAAVLFGTLNKPLEAERVYLRVLEIQPHVPTAYQRLIFYYAVTMQRTKMQKQIERCISTECDSPETYVYRLLVGSDWNAFSNAHELLGQWLKSDPDNEFFQVAYALHVVKAHSLEDKMTADKSALAAATDESSIKAREFGERISDLITRFPSNIELLVFLLNQATSNGDIDQVAKLLSKAPPEAVSDNRFWRYKGWFHAAQSELRQAEDAFREALKLNPYDWGSRHQLAEVMRRTNRLKEAEFSEQLSVQGKELREEIIKLPDVRSAPPRMLNKILNYAAACGDTLVADHLYRRMQTRGKELPHF